MPVEEKTRSQLPPQPNYLSAADMELWLRQEVADCQKATELRIKEAQAIVSSYTAGAISKEEANERYWRYQQRWGEPLPGAHAPLDGTVAGEDEKILAAIDAANDLTRDPNSSMAQTDKDYANQFWHKPGE